MNHARVITLDPAALKRLNDLDPSGQSHLLERVLGAFQSSSLRLSSQLATARASHDMDGIRLVVHTLKSSSASIGALELARLCAEIETALRGESAPELSEQLEAVDRELSAVLQVVTPMLKGTTPP